MNFLCDLHRVTDEPRQVRLFRRLKVVEHLLNSSFFKPVVILDISFSFCVSYACNSDNLRISSFTNILLFIVIFLSK